MNEEINVYSVYTDTQFQKRCNLKTMKYLFLFYIYIYIYIYVHRRANVAPRLKPR